MSKWKLSQYTVVSRTESGDAIFHNSFMGALALVPAVDFEKIEPYLEQELTLQDLENSTLAKLCQNLFFMPIEIDERKLVMELLNKESESNDFDIIIMPHENCNFRCVYCYETHQRGRMDTWVVESLKRFVKDKTAMRKNIGVRWFGGEPLLAVDIIHDLSRSFLASCEQAGVSYWSHLTTNAFLLTPPVFEQLIQDKVTGYQITLDGPEVCHDTTRILAGGGKTFKTIYNNLLQMQQSEHNFTASLRINFNDESVPLMEEFFGMISRDFGADSRFGLYFRPIVKYGGPNDDSFKTCDPGIANVIEMDLTEKYHTHGYLDKLLKRGLLPHGSICYASKKNSIIVGSDGIVYKCTVSFEDDNNKVGKLLPDGSLKIDIVRWNEWVCAPYIKNGSCDCCIIYPICQGKYCPRTSIINQKPVCAMSRATYSKLAKLAANSMTKFH